MSDFINQSYDRAKAWWSDEAPAKAYRAPQVHNTGDAPLSHMEIGSKWSYSTLEYPADIQQRSDLGHYMMFYVNVMDTHRTAYSSYNSMLKKTLSNDTSGAYGHELDRGNLADPAKDAMRKEIEFSSEHKANEFGDTSGDALVGGTWKPGSKPKVVARKHYQGRLTNQIKGAKIRTKRTMDSIVLYMPSTIQTNTNAVYKSPEMGNLAMTMGGAASSVWSRAQEIGIWGAIKEGLPGFSDMAIEDVQRAIAKVGSAIIGGDIAGGVDKLSNRAQNRFLESLFDAVGFRKFSYTFKFTPKNVQESFIAHDIIKLFRFHMSPELPDDDLGRYFIPPAEFDLFYMFRGKQNSWLNKISSCVLTNMDVNYANGRYQTFRPADQSHIDGAPPIEIDMKMDFMETRIITKKEIQEGF